MVKLNVQLPMNQFNFTALYIFFSQDTDSIALEWWHLNQFSWESIANTQRWKMTNSQQDITMDTLHQLILLQIYSLI